MTEKDTKYYSNGSFSIYLDNYVYFNWRVVYFNEFTLLARNYISKKYLKKRFIFFNTDPNVELKASR